MLCLNDKGDYGHSLSLQAETMDRTCLVGVLRSLKNKIFRKLKLGSKINSVAI